MIIEDLLQPKEKKGAIFLGEFDSFFNLTPNHIKKKKKKKKNPKKESLPNKMYGFIYLFIFEKKTYGFREKIKTNRHDCNTYMKAKSPKTC